MPDDVTPGSTTPPASPTPAPTQDPGFSIPEKFAGKSAEEVARAYSELESKFGEQGKRLGDLDTYSKLGSAQDISAALDWARQMKVALDRGLIGPKEAQKAAEQAKAGKPWEAPDWVYKSPQEQFEAFNEAAQAANREYIDSIASKYGEQLQSLMGQDTRQKQIMLRLMKNVARNPDLDPESFLAETAQLASKTPEELMDMILEMRSNSPEARKAEFDTKVSAEVARRLQEKEAQQLADITSSATPRRPQLGRGEQLTREQENKKIIDTLAKSNIKLF